MVLNLPFLLMILSSACSVQWPRGTYTLPQPKTGCPYNWQSGWRKQDNEDSHPQNKQSPSLHLQGHFGRNTVLHFCTKDEHVVEGTGYWPKGNYCILRQGLSCPRGFESGSIRWDDEDSRNKNAQDGVLPSGSYGKNTLINYCCRSDGSIFNEINLPKNKPFYLHPFKAGCQKVKDMNVQMEWVQTDDENSRTRNWSSGSHPRKSRRGSITRLFYCYYFRQSANFIV